jgi:hypothetical protein
MPHANMRADEPWADAINTGRTSGVLIAATATAVPSRFAAVARIESIFLTAI